MSGADTLVGIIMGSQSDWPTMRHAAEILDQLGISYETRIVSAHRTPQRLFDYGRSVRARGLKVIIAGAGGGAHLPGMVASLTTLPVFGVPVESAALSGLDSLLSIVQMPGGVPVGTLAIGKAGAINAALLAASVLALGDARVAEALDGWRAARAAAVTGPPPGHHWTGAQKTTKGPLSGDRASSRPRPSASWAAGSAAEWRRWPPPASATAS